MCKTVRIGIARHLKRNERHRMAQQGNGWNSFMQDKNVQAALYSICVLFCLGYALDGILELMSPERSANMITLMGAPGYYAMTIIRTVVLLITAFAFGRIVYKRFTEKDDHGE